MNVYYLECRWSDWRQAHWDVIGVAASIESAIHSINEYRDTPLVFRERNKRWYAARRHKNWRGKPFTVSYRIRPTELIGSQS